MVSGARLAFARLVFVVLASALTPAFAQQSPAVQAGVAWLQAQVRPDGSIIGEEASIANALQARTEALQALSLLATAPAGLTAFINADAEPNTEYLARRIVALKAAGLVTDAQAAVLLATQQPDGGWTLGEPFGSDATDTALALHALVTAGRATPASIAAALAYLNATKMASGGWGTNGSDNDYVTALVLLAAKSSGTAGDALTAAARARLLAMRTAGTYGSTFENSLAFLALFAAADDPALNDPLLAAIRSAQLPDGSWEHDPFVTAIALRALSAFDASYAGVRGRVQHGTTNSPIAGATATLGSTPPLVATTNASGDFVLAGARPGTYSLSITAAGFGTFTTTIGLTAGGVRDVGILRLQPDPATGAVVFGVVTRVDTGAPVADALVKIAVGGREFSVFTSATGDYRIEGLVAGSAHITVTRTGFRPLTSDRTIVGGGLYDESPRLYEDTVPGAQLDALIIDAETKAPIPGASIVLGPPNASSATTGADGRFGISNLVTGTGNITISAPGYFVAAGTVTLAAGQTLYTTLAIPPTVAGSTIRPLSGRVVDTVTRLPIPGAIVDTFYFGNIGQFLTDVDGRFTIPFYRGDVIEIGFSKQGYDRSNLIFGPDNPPASDLGDIFLRPDSVGSTLADLTIGNIDRVALTEAANGTLGGVLDVQVKNVGLSQVIGPFQVRAFIDVNRDGVFTPGTDTILGEITLVGPTLQRLDPGAVVSGSIPISGAVQFRNQPIHVWVDSGFAIIEGDETNNVRSTAEFCRLCPSSGAIPNPGNGGYTIEPEFSAGYSVVNFGSAPPGTLGPGNLPYRLDGFVVPKKGDMCTFLYGGNSESSSSAILAIKVVRDANNHIAGFERYTRTAEASGAGNGASYYKDQDLLLASSWNGTVNGLYQYKAGDIAPAAGKSISLQAFGPSVTSAKMVPAGMPGAGNLKATTWPFGEWWTGTPTLEADGFISLSAFTRVSTIAMQGRPFDFAYVPRFSQGFSKDAILLSEWDAGNLATYEVDSSGNPIVATRRVMLRGYTNIAGMGFDPLSGDLLLTNYATGTPQRALGVRGFRNPGALTDLTVSHATAAVDPAGRVTSVTARIGNAGPGLSTDTVVAVYAVRNGTRGELLAQLVIDPLATGAFVDRTIVVPPTAAPGVMVVADPGEAQMECSKANNTAVVPVQELQGTIVASTDLTSYAPASTADVNVVITNPGVAAAGYAVDVIVVDANGTMISNVGHRPIDALAPGGSTTIALTWTVPSVIAGPYVLRATLLNLANVKIGQATAPVEILAVPAAAAASVVVATNRADYGPLDTVSVTAHVANLQSNAILNGLQAVLRVKAGNGTVFYTDTKPVPQLSPLAAFDVAFAFSLSGTVPGSYSVEVTILGAGGATLAQHSTPIVITGTADSGAEVAGTLSATPSSVAAGETLVLHGVVTNAGTDIAALAMALTLVKPSDGSVVQEWTQSVPAPRGVGVNFDRNWVVPSGVAAGPYTAVLSITTAAGRRTLVQAPFTVRALPIIVSTTVAANKATYEALETATLTARAINGAAGRALANLKLVVRITGPSASVVFDSEQAVGALAPGATAERTFSFPVARSAPGTYSVSQELRDVSNAVFATAATTFTVRASTDTGIGITGTLAASPTPIVAGNTAVFSASIANAGNADAPAVPVKVTVRNAALATATEFTATLALAQAQPTLFANSWAIPAVQAPGVYTATLTATFGTTVLTLAQATITVQAPAQTGATVLPRLGSQSRVAVLVSCAGTGSGNDVPDDPFCVASRRSAIDALLADLGVTHAVTTNADEFRRLVRCGEYDTLWIAGGADKLKGTLAAEVRETVRRGGALIVDGRRDAGSAALDAVTQVTVGGTLTGVTTTVTLNGALGVGPVAALGTPRQATGLAGTTIQGTFSNGATAIVTAVYGGGKSAYFAYDLAATLAAAPTEAARRALLTSTLAFVRPAAPTGALVAGSSVILEAVVTNGNAGNDYRVDASGPGLTFSWNVTLAASQVRTVSTAFRLPATTGNATYTVSVFRVVSGVATQTDSKPITLQVQAGLAIRDTLVADLTALSLPAGVQATARNAAVTAINAGWTKATQPDVDGAMVEYVKAFAEFAKISAVPMAPFAVRVARLMQEAGLRGCTATLACSATGWSPVNYSVLVFGSASFSSGQAAGPIGVAGATSMSAYNVATALRGDAARLNVAGNLTFSSGSVGVGGTGTIRVGGTATVAASVGRAQLLTGVPTENFPALKSWYQALSTNLNALGGTAGVSDGFGKYTFTGTNAGLNVFTIPGASLGSVRTLHFNVPATGSVVLNVTGSAATLTNGSSFVNGQAMAGTTLGSRVLYNFPAASAVSVSSWAPQGTIIAPNATFSLSSGSVAGALVTNVLSTSATSFSCPGAFDGALPSSVLPTP